LAPRLRHRPRNPIRGGVHERPPPHLTLRRARRGS
jgi:hypothetical protein